MGQVATAGFKEDLRHVRGEKSAKKKRKFEGRHFSEEVSEGKGKGNKYVLWGEQ